MQVVWLRVGLYHGWPAFATSPPPKKEKALCWEMVSVGFIVIVLFQTIPQHLDLPAQNTATNLEKNLLKVSKIILRELFGLCVLTLDFFIKNLHSVCYFMQQHPSAPLPARHNNVPWMCR